MAERPQRKPKPDWERIEIDYRAGKFTLRELGEMHGVVHTTIARRAEKHGWTQDLSAAVRAATHAALIATATHQASTNAHQTATDTVLAAAEMGAQVIRAHRTRLAEVTAGADRAKEKVLGLLDTAADIREAAVAMSAIEAWARITKTVVEKERQAFGLEDMAAANPLESMTDAEIEAEYERLQAARRG